MQNAANAIQNNALAAFGAQAPRHVMHAIQKASSATGVDFAYLVQQANAESSFDPNAKARTSSATGLYQFIESTWLNTVGKHGAKHGLDTAGMTRSEVLNLRKDPVMASTMAAEFAKDNQQQLEQNWGGKVGATELYLAHFLGAGGASAFLNAKDANPLQQAAYIFPEAAAANKNVFYDRDSGRAKTMGEIYAHFDKKFSIDSIPQTAPEPPQREISSERLLAYGVENSGFEMQDMITKSLFQNAERSQGRYNGGLYAALAGHTQSLVHSPVEIMLLADLSVPLGRQSS